MIDISVLRTMAKYGADLDMVLAVIEADQIVRERKYRERMNRRLAKRMNGNGTRTVQDAANDLIRTIESIPEPPSSTTRN